VPHRRSPTLPQGEQRAIPRVTVCNPRDRLIPVLALETAQRLARIVGLNAGDVYAPAAKPRNRIRRRPEIAKNGRDGDVFLPDALVVNFRIFWRHKAKGLEVLLPESPLFCSQSRRRISPRRAQFAFRTWQQKAGVDRFYPFHALRHYAALGISGIRP